MTQQKRYTRDIWETQAFLHRAATLLRDKGVEAPVQCCAQCQGPAGIFEDHCRVLYNAIGRDGLEAHLMQHYAGSDPRPFIKMLAEQVRQALWGKAHE